VSSKSFKFKLAYGVVVWTVALAALLSTLPTTVDKYSPGLNKVLHSGAPTSDSDIDYWAVENRALQIYRDVNPDSKESIRSAMPRFQEISTQEDAIALTYENSAKKVSEVFTGAECQGY
jgi:hypothetical protein